jgi:hypothetical protein
MIGILIPVRPNVRSTIGKDFVFTAGRPFTFSSPVFEHEGKAAAVITVMPDFKKSRRVFFIFYSCSIEHYIRSGSSAREFFQAGIERIFLYYIIISNVTISSP